MTAALPVIRITGPGRNVGKTWLASKLIAALTARGYRVAAVKRSHHAVAADREGSDTDRFAAAGAASVLFCAADGTLERSPVTTLADAVRRYAGEADIVLVEGFKGDTFGAAVRLEGSSTRRAQFESMDGRVILDTVADDVPGLLRAIEREFALSAAGDEELRRWIRRAVSAHGHMCAGVVLGVRMALSGLAALGLSALPPRGSLRIVVESARCATDAISAVTGCSIGRQSLTVVDYGKMAATFEDPRIDRAVRFVAREDARDPDERFAPSDLSRKHRQTIAYRVMPDVLLFDRWQVRLATHGDEGRLRGTCSVCGESTQLARAVQGGDSTVLCRPCSAGSAYYEQAAALAEVTTPIREPPRGDPPPGSSTPRRGRGAT